MAKRKGPRYPNGRLTLDSRLWDRDGNEWDWTGIEVERADVETAERGRPLALDVTGAVAIPLLLHPVADPFVGRFSEEEHPAAPPA